MVRNFQPCHIVQMVDNCAQLVEVKPRFMGVFQGQVVQGQIHLSPIRVFVVLFDDLLEPAHETLV